MRKLLIPGVLIVLVASGWLAAEGEKALSLEAIAPEVAVLLETRHISGGAIDDERSRRIFDAYFAALDPAKMYFRQSDIDAFATSREELDDQFRRGDFRFAAEVGELFRERVEAVSALVSELLDAPFDFSRNEYRLAKRDEARYPADDEELRAEWRKDLKSRLLEKTSGSGQSLESARARVEHELVALHGAIVNATRTEWVRRFIDVVTGSFDPHTRYLPPDDLHDLEINLHLDLVGIGVVLRAEKGATLVGGLVPDGPAQREGTLRPGDEITAVSEGPAGPWIELADRKLQEVAGLIRGAEGTTIRLRLRRDRGGSRVTATIRRARVRLRQREAHGEILTVDGRPDSRTSSIGVLRLPAFYAAAGSAAPAGVARRSSTSDTRKWIDEFRTRGVEAIVLDLRGNAGGLLDEAVGVASLFLDGGAIVQVAERGSVHVFDDEDGSRAWDGPLVVLTDRLTASAGEIVAGALQDHGRALVVGDASTHGKGTVQTLVPVIDARTGSNVGALKLTTAKFYLPSGPSPQLLGIVPHVVLPSRTAGLDMGESSLPGAIPFDEIPPVEGVRADAPGVEVLDALIAGSRTRRRSSAWFREVDNALRLALENRRERWVPLQRRKFETRRAALASSNHDSTAAFSGWEPRIERDAYLDEVLAITTDYARQLRAR